MRVVCDKCGMAYDDFDHWTYCPHDRFGMSPDVAALQAAGKLRKDSGREGDPACSECGHSDCMGPGMFECPTCDTAGGCCEKEEVEDGDGA